MAKRKTLDGCIRRLLREGWLVPLYFTHGINVLKEEIDTMSDEDIYKKFSGIFAPKMIRGDITYISTTLNNFIQNEK